MLSHLRHWLIDDQAAWLRSRSAARQKLVAICPGLWCPDGKLTYYAGAGTRANAREAAGNEVADVLEAAYLAVRPPTPAVNRWSKVHGPFSWWAFGISFFGLTPKAFTMAEQDAHQDEGVISNIDMLGPPDEQAYRQLKRSRWTKATAFLVAPSTPNVALYGRHCD